MTYDGVPGGFGLSAFGGMLSVIGPGGIVPGGLLCSPPVLSAAGAVPCGGGGLVSGITPGARLGSEQAAKTPSAMTLSQMRVTSASTCRSFGGASA